MLFTCIASVLHDNYMVFTWQSNLTLGLFFVLHSQPDQCSWGNPLKTIYLDGCCLSSCVWSRIHVGWTRGQFQRCEKHWVDDGMHDIYVNLWCPSLFRLPGGPSHNRDIRGQFLFMIANFVVISLWIANFVVLISVGLPADSILNSGGLPLCSSRQQQQDLQQDLLPSTAQEGCNWAASAQSTGAP